MEALYGPERAAMLEVLGRRELTDEIARLGAASTDTHLRSRSRRPQPRRRRDGGRLREGRGAAAPDRAAVGRPTFDAWLRSWFDRHAFTSVTTDDFLADLRANLLGQRRRARGAHRSAGVAGRAGPPAERDAADRRRASTRSTPQSARSPPARRPSQLDTKGVGHAAVAALPRRPAGAAPTRPQLADLDRAFGFSKSGNSEILFAWLRIAIRHHYAPAMPALEQLPHVAGTPQVPEAALR